MRRLLPILGASFGTGVFSAFNNFTLTLWLATFTSSYLLIGLLGNSRSFVGAIVSPLAGAWSDRTWLGPLGRRRPFILVGSGLAAAVLALTPAIARLPLPPLLELDWLPPDLARLGPAIVAILVFTVFFNTMDDVHQALLVDVTRPSERNRLSSLAVVAHFAGQVAILILGFLLWQDEVPPSAFALTALLVTAGALVTVVGIREPPPDVWRAERGGAASEAHASGADASGTRAVTTTAALSYAPTGSTRDGPAVPTFVRTSVRTSVGASWRMSWRTPWRVFGLREYRGAAAFCLAFFCYWSGVNAVMPLVSVYTRDILGASVGEAQLLPALLLLSTTVLAIPMGLLGDRFGKRRVMGAGYAIVGICGLAGLVITTREQGAVVFLLAGVGNAASMVLTIPLLADLVPRDRVGAAAGILAASGSLAAPLASVVAGVLSDVYGPRVIFAMMAVMVALALAVLPSIRPPDLRGEAPGGGDAPYPATVSESTP